MRARIAAEIDAQRALLGTRAGRAVVGALAALALLTVGMAVLWPTGGPTVLGSNLVISRGIVPAEVTGVTAMTCAVETRPGCARVDLRVLGGPDNGRASSLVLPGDEAAPRLSPGDRIRVVAQGFGGAPPDPTEADPTQAPYGFVDFERRTPLLWLALGFFALVAILGRRVGVLSLLGVVVGLILVTIFVVPAILSGKSPFAVALVGSFAAMFATIVLVYGMGAKSLAALLGTAASLLLIAVLATLFTTAAHITGRSSEDATLLQSLGQGRISLGGLVLAGILIAALGVLNDVTISQASTVLALRRANPRGSRLSNWWLQVGSAPANTGYRRLPRRHLPSREPLGKSFPKFAGISPARVARGEGTRCRQPNEAVLALSVIESAEDLRRVACVGLCGGLM